MSCRSIQLIHWLPAADLAAHAHLEGREHFRQRSASGASTTPIRICTVRIPALDSGSSSEFPFVREVRRESRSGSLVFG